MKTRFITGDKEVDNEQKNRRYQSWEAEIRKHYDIDYPEDSVITVVYSSSFSSNKERVILGIVTICFPTIELQKAFMRKGCGLNQSIDVFYPCNQNFKGAKPKGFVIKLTHK